ncbi:hypothetical protein H4R33_005564 [Dimargaris cristalligena]|nr:hypothetical protein H4R33_005564 [Dimargaris cristalligena]
MAYPTNNADPAPHSNLSGREFLVWILHPSQQHLGKLIIQCLDNRDQFNLAGVCHTLGPLITLTYDLLLKIPSNII